MNEKPMTKALARRFLLGTVEDSERQRIESLFIIDSETQETILIAEDELVEDYLEGSLSEPDTAKFLEQYAHGPRQRRKLRIAASLREYAQSDALRHQSEGSALGKLRTFFSRTWPRERRLYLPIAVAMATVLVVTTVWLVRWNTERVREAHLRLSIEQQLAELNAPSSLRENPAQMVSLVLPSVSLRSGNSPASMSHTRYRVFELQLLWPHQEEFQSYLAVLRRVGDTEPFTIANLQAEKKSGSKVVRLRLPAQSLTPGFYQVSLSASASDGISGLTEEYEFMIGG
jgi:hypothetical protein